MNRLLWFLSLTCFLVGASAPAQEWTRFRGPNGSGLARASAVPVNWTEKDLTWKVKIPGIGHSSPVLWGHKLFVTSCEKDSGNRLVVCLDANKGTILWTQTFKADPYHTHRRNNYAASTPTVDADRLYLCWATPKELTVLALDHQGKTVWEKSLGRYKGNHGFAVSPILYEELLIVPNDQDRRGSILALEKATGKVRWQIPRKSGNATYSTPCVYQSDNRPAELIFTNWKHGMTAVDPKTGKVTWELSVFEPDKKERAIASPVVAGKLVLGTCGFVTRQKHFVAVRPPQKPGDRPQEVWREERSVSYLPTPVVKDGLVFLCSEKGIATCMRADTGKQVWQHRVQGQFYASPVCVGDRLYCVSDKGDVVVLRAAAKYEMLGKGVLGEPTQATPAVALGRVYFRTHSHVMALGKP